jgi:hypothetical protein
MLEDQHRVRISEGGARTARPRCRLGGHHVQRAIDNGYDGFCFTIDIDSHSRRERDIAKRHQRRHARVSVSDEEARIYQARFNWRDIERIKKNFDIPILLKGIGTAEDAKVALECGADCVYVSNHGGRQLDQGVGSIDVLPEVVEAVGGRARVMPALHPAPASSLDRRRAGRDRSRQQNRLGYTLMSGSRDRDARWCGGVAPRGVVRW